MKNIFKIGTFFFTLSMLLLACKKDEIKTLYSGGKTPVLSASATELNMNAIDSNKNIITFSWTDPAYSFSSGPNTLNVTHTLEIDSAGRNFSKPQVFSSNNVLQESQTGTFVRSFTGEEFNSVLLKLGLQAGKTYTINVRVSSSLYVESTKLMSNVITMDVTPYSTEPVPLYPVPEKLFIVGSATDGGWNNPVPEPAQRFAKLDKNTFGIVVRLKANEKYLFLPENGSWAHKYAVADNSTPESKTEASFTVDNGQDIIAPDVTGLYKIIVNFLTGMYTVTPFDASIVPDELFIVGNATDGGWNNPVPVPSQKFTKTSPSTFELTLNLNSGGYYLFLPKNGSWDHKYAIANKNDASFKTGGILKIDSGEDIPAPDESGTYKIEVNFLNMSYKVTK